MAVEPLEQPAPQSRDLVLDLEACAGPSQGSLGEKHCSRNMHSTTDLRVLWKNYSLDPDFFKAVEIDKQAGFDELHTLMSPMRYLSALICVVWLIMNAYYLILLNLVVLKVHAVDDTGSHRAYLLSKHFFQYWLDVELSPEKGIACLELGLGLLMALWILLCVVKILLPPNATRKWMAVSRLVFHLVPWTTSMSAMKLLNYVTPQVISADLFHELESASAEGWYTRCLPLLWFVASRLLCGLVGFDAFLLKFQVLAHFLHDQMASQHTDPVMLGTAALIFLNQMLGVVQVSMFVQQRIFAFIFAGENGSLSSLEQSQMMIWEAMFAKHVWHCPKLQWHQALAIYLSFSDADFQQLVLDPRARPRRRAGAESEPEEPWSGSKMEAKETE